MPKRKRTNTYVPRKRRRVVRRKRYARYRRRPRSSRYRRFRGRKSTRTPNAGRNPTLSTFLNPYRTAPREVYVKMYFSDMQTLVASNTLYGIVGLTYNANSIVDGREDDGAAKRSVSRYSFLTPYYKNYTVYASKCKVIFQSACDHGNDTFLYPSTVTTKYSGSLPGYDFLLDQRSKKGHIPARVTTGKPSVLTHYMKTRHMRTTDDVDDADFMGLFGDSTANSTDPTLKWYWQVGIRATPTTNQSTNLIVYAKVYITYYVKLHNYAQRQDQDIQV